MKLASVPIVKGTSKQSNSGQKTSAQLLSEAFKALEKIKA